MELPAEEERRTTKLTKSQEDVEDTVTYLKNVFWIYANDDRYDLAADEYQDKVSSSTQFIHGRIKVLIGKKN